MRIWILSAMFIPLRFWPRLERRLENWCEASMEMNCTVGIERELTSRLVRGVIDARMERIKLREWAA